MTSGVLSNAFSSVGNKLSSAWNYVFGSSRPNYRYFERTRPSESEKDFKYRFFRSESSTLEDDNRIYVKGPASKRKSGEVRFNDDCGICSLDTVEGDSGVLLREMAPQEYAERLIQQIEDYSSMERVKHRLGVGMVKSRLMYKRWKGLIDDLSGVDEGTMRELKRTFVRGKRRNQMYGKLSSYVLSSVDYQEFKGKVELDDSLREMVKRRISMANNKRREKGKEEFRFDNKYFLSLYKTINTKMAENISAGLMYYGSKLSDDEVGIENWRESLRHGRALRSRLGRIARDRLSDDIDIGLDHSSEYFDSAVVQNGMSFNFSEKKLQLSRF